MANIDGVTDQRRADARRRPSRSPDLPVQAARPRTARSPSATFTFNFGKNGWNDIPDAADEIRDITKMDGVTVHLAGYGGQAADSAEAFEGIDTTLHR